MANDEQIEDIIDSAAASPEDDAQKSTQTTNDVNDGPSPAPEEQKKENGWYTSLPKEYREDAQQYGSMKEYLAALNTPKADGKTEKDDEPKADDWEGFLEGIKNEGKDSDAPLFTILKDSGVSVESTKKIIESMDAASKKALEDTRAGLSRNMHELWGDEYDTNKAAVKRGMNALDNKVKAQLFDAGLMYHPAVVDLVSRLGRNSSEVTPPVGKNPAKNGCDPKNPLGYKD